MKIMREEIRLCPVDGNAGDIYLDHVRDVYFGTSELWSYRKNPLPGHLWLDPRPMEESFSEIYQNYYTHETENIQVKNNTNLWNRVSRIILNEKLGYPKVLSISFKERLISRFPTIATSAQLEVFKIPGHECGTLLDFGCGNGSFMELMKGFGWTVYGIEPDSARSVDSSRSKHIYQSIQDLKSNVNIKFDVIILSHVIEHLPDPYGLIKDLKNLCTSKGRVIIATPNAKSLCALIFGRYWRGLEPPRHFNIFTRESLIELLENSGYQITLAETHIRQARSAFYFGVLGMLGKSDMLVGGMKNYRPLKLVAYIFQMIEAVLNKTFPSLGEEILVITRPKDYNCHEE
jgi:2-polyprenyl-3-methyl-5-hydroxy-6-metoxy-1,4-benzoquinol methylase